MARAEQGGHGNDGRRQDGPFGWLVRGVVRPNAFIVKEFTEVRRQPLLLLTLVLGPFLLLLLFGLGYGTTVPAVTTLVVLPPESTLPNDPARYREAFGRPFVFAGLTQDIADARRRLAAREVGALLILPATPFETIQQGEKAQLTIEYNELNPLMRQWINYYAYVQTVELNNRVLLEGLRSRSDTANANDLAASANALQEGSGRLRSAIGASDRPAIAAESLALRQENRQVQARLLALAQVYGGIAIFFNVDAPQETPQGRALIAAEQARQGIDGELDQLDSTLLTGGGTPTGAVADAIAGHASVLATSAQQLRPIPPEVLVAPFSNQARNIAPIEPDFVVFYGPAVLALLLQHIAITLSALTLVRERLLGTAELFQVAPLGPTEVVVGKFASYLLLNILFGAVMTAALHFILGVPLLGGGWIFSGMVLLLILASLAVGFLISALANSESQAVQLALLTLLASVFFGGFLVALEAFLPFVRVISYALPVTYGIIGLRVAMLRGESPPLYAVVALAAITVVCLTLSIALFRRQVRQG